MVSRICSLFGPNRFGMDVQSRTGERENCDVSRRKQSKQTEALRRSSNPPENLGQDFPFLLAVQHNGLIFTIFRLQNFRRPVTLKTGHAQPHLFMPSDYDFAIQCGWVALRRVDGKDGSIAD